MASAAPSSLPAALAKPRKRKRPATTAATSSKQQATEQDSGFGSRPERTAAAEMARYRVSLQLRLPLPP